MTLRFAPEAEQDLLAIAEFIGEDNPDRAADYIEEIIGFCTELEDRPLAYRLRHEWGQAVRAARYGSYLVIYECPDDAVLILRILRGRRDVGSILRDT
ncbi:type II toxin-antitoxin system RelE/ParE family toxin [Alteriqipengyuania sp. NZ-12B]|uniref:Type II toxin-antitoxin system RelE/ParE family toxin n=1 Tax=Alteriqipengyuania abyssalis TaxID=2860200 RepID=A0ABS7PDX9_9SPHN|nr:type II toxin-antitoxin system RelE/ParE family toxin [Alteriqipengyuania abyssalis]MBY8337279.1 type II toxin-antitoxin system RelE/ParE family toxin [Alteriqipengyuania abyssalis]